MPTWLKVTLGGLALIAVCVLAVAGTGGYFVFSNLERRDAPEIESVKAIEVVKSRFGSRLPLVEVIDPRTANVRINRVTEPSTAVVSTIHIINWKAETNELATTKVPLWLMRFSSLNILSQIGVAPAQFRLTVDDIVRYGPGILVEYSVPGSLRMLVWTD